VVEVIGDGAGGEGAGGGSGGRAGGRGDIHEPRNAEQIDFIFPIDSELSLHGSSQASTCALQTAASKVITLSILAKVLENAGLHNLDNFQWFSEGRAKRLGRANDIHSLDNLAWKYQ
jgi:hypothetical protein